MKPSQRVCCSLALPHLCPWENCLVVFFLRVQGPPGADGGVGCKGLMVRRGLRSNTLLLYWHPLNKAAAPLTKRQRFSQPWRPGIQYEGCYWLTRLQTHLTWFERTAALWSVEEELNLSQRWLRFSCWLSLSGDIQLSGADANICTSLR